MGESIGIDLGTTNSGAAHFEGGRARILPTSWSEPLTPSAVCYNARKGRFEVGRQARDLMPMYPTDTALSVKRLMGHTLAGQDAARIATVQDRFGYSIVPADDPQDRGVRILLGSQKYSPVDISTMILKQIKEDASKALGNRPVTHAVVTVPAYFNERQRAATRQAAERAGLIVKKIIDEPTAAAVAFGMDRVQERHRVLVYDLGGGTFDISLIQMTQKQFQVLEIEGDNWLGGDDFDLKIVQHVLDWIRDREGLDLSQDKSLLARVKAVAERAKIALSAQEEVDLYTTLETETGTPVTLDLEITRQQFNAWIQGYVDRSMTLVRRVLDSQNLAPDDITAVLMVGGATNVPLVYETVNATFGPEKVRRDIDPMQCVALGAAILAARLKTVECPQCGYENPPSLAVCEKCQHGLAATESVGDVALTEVTSHTLGIETVRGETAGLFSRIIRKGQVYPVTGEQRYLTTSERLIRMPIYEGEDDVAANNQVQAVIEFELPEHVPLKTPVNVSFGYNRDRELKVSIRVIGYPHLVYEQVIKRDRARPIVERSEQEELDRWRRSLEVAIRVANHFLSEYGAYMVVGVRKRAGTDIQQGRQALIEGNREEGERIVEALHKTLFGSGTATQLFVVEQIIGDVGPQEARDLRRGVHELQAAHRRGEVERVAQIAQALQVHVGDILKKQKGYADAATDFEGLLMEIFE
jgi:molecular chaperone DnaK